VPHHSDHSFLRKRASRRAVFPLAAALLFLFLFPLCPPRTPAAPAGPPAAAERCVYDGVEKVVAIGDLHGAYDPFVDILRKLEIVDDGLHWIAGKTHLVQMGDVMDRGPSARDILDLLKRLEGEARKSGGAVHMLLGNHEEMNILGLSFEVKGNVPPAQFRAFLPEWIRERKDAEFRQKTDSPEEYEALWEDYEERNADARNLYTKSFNESYGRWLAARPVILKINDIVFVHGGISESISTESCERINAEFRSEFLRIFRGDEFIWRRLYQDRGPLWYRDLAMKDEDTLREEVQRILANLGAQAIVIGHTTIAAAESGRSVSRLGGQIWIIDTGIWMKNGGRESALIIENGHIRIAYDPFRKREVRR